MLRHNIVKLLKTKDKEKQSLKQPQGKNVFPKGSKKPNQTDSEFLKNQPTNQPTDGDWKEMA